MHDVTRVKHPTPLHRYDRQPILPPHCPHCRAIYTEVLWWPKCRCADCGKHFNADYK